MAFPNVFEAQVEYDDTDPPRFHSGVANVGGLAGGTENIVKLFELPPGVRLCPYHYEFVEEWLLVLDGTVDLRGPDGTKTAPAGTLVCFPRGPEGAHQVTCKGERAARVLMWSSAQHPAVSVYPDADKIGVWPGNPDDNVMMHRADGRAGYFDGEPDA